MLDVIIIGGGLAGLTAGLYANRAGLSTLLFEKMFVGGQAATTYLIENYPGFEEPISGPDLSMKIESHARKFGLEIQYDEVTKIEMEGQVKRVHTENRVYESRTLIIATGAEPKTLGLAKEDEFRGRGVSYCATCDGLFYKDKDVVVVGGGDTAVEDAEFLAQYVNKVYLVHRRDSFRANKTSSDRVMANDKIKVIWDTVVEEILGDENVTGVGIRNLKTGEKSQLKADGMFVAIGIVPNNDLVKGQLKQTEAGFVLTDENMKTDIAGVFAAGDIRQKPLWQLVTAVSDGAIAAVSAQRYIIENFK
ncbi:MAG: thioredoxin-disulfide reductase [Caldicoprobacterales bacterium]|jgi:thioredoxin reductase (NADPH)|nr:thioredoxin-disulfide reductase [Clostridia bacterium]MDI9512714.1 thioredoxin-disulfide reductase [Bacillota bacterium]NLH59207.1 thioredoxin-disulfide reductase [Clostridiales bacterium]